MRDRSTYRPRRHHNVALAWSLGTLLAYGALLLWLGPICCY
jgi:hypothetical protein